MTVSLKLYLQKQAVCWAGFGFWAIICQPLSRSLEAHLPVSAPSPHLTFTSFPSLSRQLPSASCLGWRTWSIQMYGQGFTSRNVIPDQNASYQKLFHSFTHSAFTQRLLYSRHCAKHQVYRLAAFRSLREKAKMDKQLQCNIIVSLIRIVTEYSGNMLRAPRLNGGGRGGFLKVWQLNRDFRVSSSTDKEE